MSASLEQLERRLDEMDAWAREAHHAIVVLRTLFLAASVNARIAQSIELPEPPVCRVTK